MRASDHDVGLPTIDPPVNVAAPRHMPSSPLLDANDVARGRPARFRTDVQGLRAVAVIPVMLYHFGVGAVPGGFTGVDIFFCISGFVIAGSIAHDIGAGRFSIVDFYFKRVRRIFPALAATLIATTVVAMLVLLPTDAVGYNRSLLATSTFWSNIYFWKASGYFGAEAQTQPLLHTWSLSVEEQFYFIAPVAFALIYRFGRRRWLLFLLPAAVASFAVGIAAVFVAPAAGFFLLPSRAWELLIGAIVALRRPAGPIGPARREALAWTGLALIAAGLLMLHESDPFPGWNALLPCLGTALVIEAGRDAVRLPTVGRLLSVKPLLWIGNISYSLYLVHWPVVALTRYETLMPLTDWQIVLASILCIGLAAFLWRFVESPWRHIDRRWRWRVLGGGAGMIAAFAGVAAICIAGGGFPKRFPGYVHQTVSGAESWGGQQCFNTDPNRSLAWDATACTRIHGSNGRILLWGDSFAAQYTPGILREAALIDADVLQYTFAGCPPIMAYRSIARIGCAASNRVVPALIRQQRIDTVVLSARWAETPRRELLQLHQTVEMLRRMGVRVVVFGQSPAFAADVQQIDFISGSYRRPGTARWPVAFRPELNELIRREASGAIFVDPIAALCGGAVCPYRIGDKFLYSDYGHFSTLGSMIAVERYFPVGDRHGRLPAR